MEMDKGWIQGKAPSSVWGGGGIVPIPSTLGGVMHSCTGWDLCRGRSLRPPPALWHF